MGDRIWEKRYHPPGTPPGTLVAHGERAGRQEGAPQDGAGQRRRRCRLDRVVYDPEQLDEALDVDVERCLGELAAARTRAGGAAAQGTTDGQAPCLQPGRVTWIHVVSPGPEELSRLGACLGLHPLALEDVLNVPQRAKVEEYPEHLFVVAHVVRLVSRHRQPLAPVAPGRQTAGGVRPYPRIEQVSFFLGQGFVVTVQEGEGDLFEPVRHRLRRGTPIRSRGADYLLYALLDAVVDSLFPVVEHLDDHLQRLEHQVERLAEEPVRPRRRREARGGADQAYPVLADLHRLRRDLFLLRRTLLQQQQMLDDLYGAESPWLSRAIRLYLRDVRDHGAQVLDAVHAHLDLAASLSDLYLSAASFRLGEITKVLTIIATLFIPLSFMAGVYGMNFDPDVSPWNMPELRWTWGYPFALGLMAAVAALMLLFFRRRGWW